MIRRRIRKKKKTKKDLKNITQIVNVYTGRPRNTRAKPTPSFQVRNNPFQQQNLTNQLLFKSYETEKAVNSFQNQLDIKLRAYQDGINPIRLNLNELTRKYDNLDNKLEDLLRRDVNKLEKQDKIEVGSTISRTPTYISLGDIVGSPNLNTEQNIERFLQQETRSQPSTTLTQQTTAEGRGELYTNIPQPQGRDVKYSNPKYYKRMNEENFNKFRSGEVSEEEAIQLSGGDEYNYLNTNPYKRYSKRGAKSGLLYPKDIYNQIREDYFKDDTDATKLTENKAKVLPEVIEYQEEKQQARLTSQIADQTQAEENLQEGGRKQVDYDDIVDFNIY